MKKALCTLSVIIVSLTPSDKENFNVINEMYLPTTKAKKIIFLFPEMRVTRNIFTRAATQIFF